jgi:hypothetical protein
LNQEQLNWILTTYNSPDSKSNISKDELDAIYQRFLSKKQLHAILPYVFESKYDFIESMGDSKIRAEKLKQEIQNELKGNSKMKK